MNIEDLIDELSALPVDQWDYEVVLNMGDETTGDIFVRVGQLRWEHNDRRVVVEPEE